MGLFDDYLAGLDGKDDLDPVSIAKDLHEIHTKEIGIREAKINELAESVNTVISEKSELEKELDKQKARNYDLAGQLPGAIIGVAQDKDTPDPGRITIDDLFKK